MLPEPPFCPPDLSMVFFRLVLGKGIIPGSFRDIKDLTSFSLFSLSPTLLFPECLFMPVNKIGFEKSTNASGGQFYNNRLNLQEAY